MSIKFICPGCGHKLRAQEDLAGKRVRCTRCSRVTVVPVPVETPPHERPLMWAVPVGAQAAVPNRTAPPPEEWPIDSLVAGQVQQPPLPSAPPRPLRRTVAPANDDAELENRYRRALQQLGGSAVALAVLCGIAAVVLLVSGEGAALGLVALLSCAIWAAGGPDGTG